MDTPYALRSNVARVNDHRRDWTCHWPLDLVPGVLVDGSDLLDSRVSVSCPVHLVQEEVGVDLLDLEQTSGDHEHEPFASPAAVIESLGCWLDVLMTLVAATLLGEVPAIERMATSVGVGHPFDPVL